MKPLQSAAVSASELAAAITDESNYDRIWLPREAWWEPVLANQDQVAQGIHRKLSRGEKWPRSEVVDVRKPGHGLRPVSVMNPEVRVVYRAVTSGLVSESQRVDRSSARYADFVLEPIKAGFNEAEGLRRILDSKFEYVVEADIAGFYQYIDHAILRDEFDFHGGDIELVDGLVGLLKDIEGKSFGIPQRSEPSDWVSEIYATRVERGVARDGFDVWRYTDDFRIGCTSYPEALRAIESLARAARDVGLLLNDQKTLTPSFFKYFLSNSDTEVNDVSDQIDPSDVEAAVTSDYAPADDDQALEEAESIMDSLQEPEEFEDLSEQEREWNIGQLDAKEHRAVRRSLNTLTKLSSAIALPKLASILAYQPSMTHLVVRYAAALGEESKEAISELFDKAIRRMSLSEWQRVWVAYGLRACEIDLTRPNKKWLKTQLTTRPNSLSACESAVTLSTYDEIDFRSLDASLRIVSADFEPWYLRAIALLRQSGSASAQQISTIRESSLMASAILT